MKNNRFLLIAAVASGLVATVMAFMYLQAQSPQTQPEPVAMIVVARHDLQAGTMINVDKDLELLEIPAKLEQLTSLGVTSDYISSLQGRQINRPILEGTPVMYADVVPLTDLTLSGDHRALSIPVDGANAVSGLVMPGDYVKIFVTKPVEQPQESSEASDDTPEERLAQILAGAGRGNATQWETLLIWPDQAFKVLAVGPYLSGSRKQFSAAAGPGRSRSLLRYSTVTLQVTEQQAQHILERSGAGSLPLTLILCPPPEDAS